MLASVAGIAEDRIDSIWRSKVADVLCARFGMVSEWVDLTPGELDRSWSSYSGVFGTRHLRTGRLNVTSQSPERLVAQMSCRTNR